MKHPKQYCVGVSSSVDCPGLPTFVTFEIDEPAAREIVRLSELVKSNDLYKVEKFDWQAMYLRDDPGDAVGADDNMDDVADLDESACEDDPITVDAPTLNVSDDEFWFAASLHNADIEVTSAHLAIRELIEHFGLTPSAVSDGTQQLP